MFEAPRQIESAVIGTANAAPRLAPFAPIDIRQIWATIWRGKTIIFLTTAAALVLMALFVLLSPHRYTATAQILIDPTDLHAVGNELTPANQMSDAAVLQVESQVRVLTSDSVLRRVVDTQGLDRDAESIGPPWLLQTLYSIFGITDGQKSDTNDTQSANSPSLLNTLLSPLRQRHGRTVDKTLAALTALKRAVQVKRAERTYVVDVSVTSRVPEKAARLANAITQAYLAEQTQVRSDAARQISQSLSARLNELKDRVRESEERVETFKAHNNIVGASGQLVNEQQLSELNNQLGTARARTAEAKARLDQVERLQQSKGDIGAFPEAVQSPTITALRTQYAEVVRREAEQMTSLGPRHPAVIEIQAQAERLRRMIEEEVGRTALSARSEYESARSNEEALARNLEALKHNAITTNESLVSLRELERDVQASRTVYESFLVRARETGEQERLDTKNIRVISRADLPLHRSFPPSNTLLGLAALMLGIGAGTGIVMLRSGSNNGAAEPVRDEAPSNATKLSLPPPLAKSPPTVPVLATLPSAEEDAGPPPPTGVMPSSFAVKIHELHHTLQANRKNGDRPSTLVVACDDANDTAEVACGLAALAALTEPVLVIDADMERRTMSAFAADRSEAGLVDVALGRRILSDIVVRDERTNISMLPFVSPNSRRGRDINDEDLKAAFGQAKDFGLVIVVAFDSERDPTGRFFAGLVDDIVLVAKADTHGEGIVSGLASRLGVDAQKIRGAVLTGAAAG